MKNSILVFIALLFALNLSFPQNEFCYYCPPGTTLTTDGVNWYCVDGSGQTVSVPLWAKPLWAKPVWSYPDSYGNCPFGSISTVQDGRTWCAKCPEDYIWQGEFCYQCPSGYLYMVGPQVRPRNTCIVLTGSDWQRLSNHKGSIQSVPDGLLIVGDNWTNGREVNGFMDGNGVESTRVFDMSRGGQIRLKFAINGSGKYMALTYWALSGVKTRNLSTNNTWHGSVKVRDGIWLYAQATISSDGSYRITVSDQGYDGTPIAEHSGTLQDMQVRLRLEFIDNHSGNTAAAILAEAEVCPN